MAASMKTKQLVKKHHLASFVGGLSLACVSVLATAPSALALNFGVPDTLTENPFFFNSTNVGTNWDLKEGTDEVEFSTCIPEDESFQAPCVQRTSDSSVNIYSGGPVAIYTWTLSGTRNSPYLIKFKGILTNVASEPTTTNTSAALLINGISVQDLPEEEFDFTINGFELAANQSLTFQITNTTGIGDLSITDFSATPVPSPLPFAGLGLAALGIYRARRCKITATPK